MPAGETLNRRSARPGATHVRSPVKAAGGAQGGPR